MSRRDISAYDLELMRHALGADGDEPGYRNHYAADPNGADAQDWARLVALGYAELVRSAGGIYPLDFYAVTSKGQKLVGVKERK